MIRLKSEGTMDGRLGFKRSLQMTEDDDNNGVSSPKRPSLMKRLQDVSTDRQGQVTKVLVVK